MTKQEFEAKVDECVSTEEYKVIEFVYTWHPSIHNIEGKDQIATLYKVGGIRVIRDMMPTAEKAKKLDEEIFKTKQSLERLQFEYSAL